MIQINTGPIPLVYRRIEEGDSGALRFAALPANAAATAALSLASSIIFIPLNRRALLACTKVVSSINSFIACTLQLQEQMSR